jgi:endonuclease/exonuclease/phosphatase family metal-dependent hydrolase
MILLYAILFLAFFQLLTDLVEATYAFGLLMTGIPVEIASILLLLSPVLLLVFPRRVPRRFLVISAGLVLVCRAGSVVLDTRGQMLLSGVGTGLFLLFLPVLVWHYGQKKDKTAGISLAAGLALAVLLSILLRALYSGNDITGYGIYRSIGWGLALLACVLMPGWARSLGVALRTPILGAVEPEALAGAAHSRGWRTTGLCLGLASALVLLYFAFTSPTVIARWSGGFYTGITALAAGSLALFLALWSGLPGLRRALTPKVVFAWNLAFAAALGLALYYYQVPFPKDSMLYPFYEPAAGPLAGAALGLALLLYPVILVDFGLWVRALIDEAPSIRRLAGGFSLAALFMLLMIFAQVFTTVYDYIPVVGPWFRDRFWLVFLAAGIGLSLPVLLLRSSGKAGLNSADLNPNRRAGFQPATDAISGIRPFPVAVAALVLAAAAILAVLLTSAKPAAAPDKTSLRILTYNLQQGYSANGIKNFTRQLEVLRRANADIIGLQETDTARAAGGNSDAVRYFADQLELYSYYGPTSVTGTFGIALLSRYPILNPRTFFMYSAGEQTAAIQAQVVVGGKTFNLLVTHLGNGGPLIQQNEVLENLAGKENIIAVGDFNFTPDTDQYRLTTGVLADAWLAGADQRLDPPGQDLTNRIDHILLSPGTQVTTAEYLGPGPSDHPAMVVDIYWK